ncbi:Gfo/Idh/MocA family oxidoreductase [Ruficoccus amylovorans]|uniref:Gfo/Idh/MocA family oxidoreductase n=1 Tax=Ruficoccus amylovorans TaxID=1804625 RepID=A0A842HIQ5_9BACT|nr:Gfo/Idh/MocA family oxidoreductase [Ruficoccus amylovorans]MBC2595868.1 Gfo/Idh/MocA family oxidoreductase [Ruficoccus amylovorans]
MSTPIKFGICGLGRIGVQHGRHFSADAEHYQPVAFCDLDANRAKSAVKEYGGRAYTDYTEFLANADMDLAIIATRSLDHAQNAQQALAAGKTVLLEKPIGVTEADYQLLQRLDREYPGKLYCGHNHRFEPALQNTLATIAEGLLGKVQVIKLCKHHGFIRRNDWQMRLDCGGGQLSVWAPHLLDQSMQLIGSPIREVSSYLRRILTSGDADDHVHMTLTGENDIVAELEISNAVALSAPYCTVFGDRGTLVYGQDQQEIHLKYLDPRFRWPEESASADTPEIGAASYGNQELPWIEERRPVEPEVNMWQFVEIELVRHLYNALREGVPFPVKNEDALEVVRLTEVVKKQNAQFNWIG